MRTGLRRLRRNERGMALVMALGMTTILSLVIATLIDYASSNSRASRYSKASQSAYTVAQAGINNAMSVLNLPANNALDPCLLHPPTNPPGVTCTSNSPFVNTYEGGTATWYGTLNTSTLQWTLYSTGSITNPTGPSASPVTRTLSATVQVNNSFTQPANNQIWSYLYATRTGNACDLTVPDNVVIWVTVFAEGNVCLGNPAGLMKGPVVIKGQLNLTASPDRVGNLTAPVNEAHIVQGCKLVTNPLHNPCSSADHVYAKVLDNTAPPITPPSPAFSSWYTNASPGPTHPCTTTSGTPPTFDTDATFNNSVPGVFNLTPSTSYTCSNASGQISWNAATRTLTVSGAIFIDGSVSVANGQLNQYSGQGTLYLAGTFLLTEDSMLCGAVSGGSCNFAGWDPNTNLLGIAANGSGGQLPAGEGIRLADQSVFQGGLYATNTIEFSGTARTQGPAVASTFIFGNSVTATPFPKLTRIPIGMPVNPSVYAQPSPPGSFTG